jgi:hypothetical protein
MVGAEVGEDVVDAQVDQAFEQVVGGGVRVGVVGRHGWLVFLAALICLELVSHYTGAPGGAAMRLTTFGRRRFLADP